MTYKSITLSKKAKDITGQTFNRLTAISPIGRTAHGSIKWLCICKCGTYHTVRLGGLTSGMTQSCGCRKREGAAARMTTMLTTHGMTHSLENGIWRSMRKRCKNKNDDYYHLYGGRGITVCKRWDKFENFYADMGKRPTNNHSIDRIDNNGNYTPENCRWVTMKQQCRNKRNNRLISFNGETRCVAEWAEIVGIHKSSLLARLNKGLSTEQVLAPAKN